MEEKKRAFKEFLAPEDGEGEYVGHIEDLQRSKKNRLIVNLDELRAVDADSLLSWSPFIIYLKISPSSCGHSDDMYDILGD